MGRGRRERCPRRPNFEKTIALCSPGCGCSGVIAASPCYAVFPSGGVVIGSLVFIVAGCVGERFVSRRCNRQYLRKHAAAVTMDA